MTNNQYLKYSRLYLGMFSIIGIVASLFLIGLGIFIRAKDESTTFVLYSGITLHITSLIILSSVVLIKGNRKIGAILTQLGCTLFIIALSYSLLEFSFLFAGITKWVIPILIWIPLCMPFAIIISYIWRWSKKWSS